MLKLAIVIPTRNRADLAINAIRSVLEARVPQLRIVVAENSTDPAERAKVREFCAASSVPIDFAPPDVPLSMADNWNYALERALAIDDVTHATIVTDRMLLKPGELPILVDAVAAHPDRVMIFMEDRAYDDRDPVGLVQARWTGRLVEVSAARLLELAAGMQLHPAPRIMNCVVPREVFIQVRRRFGSITGPVSPDYVFAYRCLAVVDSVYYFDRSPVLYYAWNRSNGQSFGRGIQTRDSADFLKNLSNDWVPNACSPIPELSTIVNSIVHEYCKVQQQTNDPKFPPIDFDQYLLANDREIDTTMRNEELRQRMKSIIAARGPFSRRPSLFRFVQRALGLAGAPALQPMWRAVAKLTGFVPPGDSPVAMRSTREALRQVEKWPRRRHISALHLRVLLGRGRTVAVYKQRARGRFPVSLTVPDSK